MEFRLGNRRLPIQQTTSLVTSYDEGICTICNGGEVGDEFHYLLNCSNENVQRTRINLNVPKICSHVNLTTKPEKVKSAKFINCSLDLL